MACNNALLTTSDWQLLYCSSVRHYCPGFLPNQGCRLSLHCLRRDDTVSCNPIFPVNTAHVSVQLTAASRADWQATGATIVIPLPPLNHAYADHHAGQLKVYRHLTKVLQCDQATFRGTEAAVQQQDRQDAEDSSADHTPLQPTSP